MVSLSLSLKTPRPRAVQVSSDTASTEHTSNQSKSQRREFGTAEERCGTHESVTVFSMNNLFCRISIRNLTRPKVQLYMESHCSGCKAPNAGGCSLLIPIVTCHFHVIWARNEFTGRVNLVISHSSESRKGGPITKNSPEPGSPY